MSNFVSLDGFSMADVSSCVRIVDVIELRPSRTTTSRERLGAPGSFLVKDHLNTRQVRVQFAILTDDEAERTRILSELTAWAMEGRWLQLGDRPGPRLRIVCTDTPLTMSKRKWTELFEMTFTAFGIPFWEDAMPVQAYAAGTTDCTLPISPMGTVRQVPLLCSVTPTDNPLTTLRIAANGAEMAFSGLAVPAGKTLAIDYEDGLLTAKWTADDGTVTPCLRCRTGAEYIPINSRQNNNVRIITDVACSVTIGARGWHW